jgi:cell wall-associated NlpC family hydrolase
MDKRVLIISAFLLGSISLVAQDFTKLEGLYQAGKIEKCITKSKKFKKKAPSSPVPYFYDFKCFAIKLTDASTPFSFRENLYNTLVAADQLLEKDQDRTYTEKIAEELSLILGIANQEVVKLEEEGKTDRVEMFEALIAEFQTAPGIPEKLNTKRPAADTTADSSEEALTNTSSDHTAPTNMRGQLALISESLIGTPYRYGGMDPNGFDCSGFTSYVFSACAMQIPRTSSDQSLAGKKIDLKQVRKGDLLFFGTKKKISHVALVVSREQ